MSANRPSVCPRVSRFKSSNLSARARQSSPGGVTSGSALDDAIHKIETGELAFLVQAHRKTVGVIVAVSPSGKKYLKSETDGDQPDTLLRLPECLE
ncbi:MAG TPA: DUF3892 domain-containing protein [Methylocella sp.]